MKILYIDCFYGFSAPMLLGALADIGAKTEDAEKELSELSPNACVSVENVLRMSIECKTASITADCSDTVSPHDLWEKAIRSAAQSLGADYIMCSALPLADNTDGEIISLLERGGIDTVAADNTGAISLSDARLLASLASESGPKPFMDIISVGYGADAEDNGRFLCVTLGQYNQELFTQEQSEYEELV